MNEACPVVVRGTCLWDDVDPVGLMEERRLKGLWALRMIFGYSGAVDG